MTATNLKKNPGDRLAFPAPYEPFGLTKRELFAAMAMQGLSSNPAMCTMSDGPASAIAQWAVQHADALLAELAKDGA